MNPNAAMVCQHDTLLVVLAILMPLGQFCLWTPGLVWHLIVDALIILAYFSIPIAFVYFVRKRKDITLAWMFVCLGIFTLSGIATYLMETWNVHHSHYWLSGAIKALAALASVPTAILLARLARLVPALRASEERMRAVLESALDCIVTIDHHGRVVEFNPAAEKTFGYKRDATIGQLMADLIIPPSLRERHRRGLELYLSTREASVLGQRIELTGMRSDHSEFPAELAITRVGSQEPPMFTGFIRDITERKRVEQSQRESRLRYETLVQSIDGIVWEADPKTFMLTFVSKQAERILGYPLERWLEEPNFWPDHIHPDDRDWAVKFCVDARVRGEDHQFEYRMISADGRVVWLHDIVTLDIGPDQSVTLRGIMVDITERKLAEEALRDSERRFRQIAENINEVFRVWTATPGAPHLLYVSPAYATLWGRSCESLYSSPQSWKEALHPQDKEWVLAEIADLDVAKSNDLTYRIVRPDQSTRWIRDRIFPVRDEDGVVVRFAGIAEDITERKQTAEAQERALSLMLATLESTADGILVVNTEGKIVTFNRLFARMWRLSDEVLASKEDARALDCVLDQLNEPEKFLEKVRYLYQHSGEESFDRLVFKDGRVFERYSRPQFIGGKVAGRVWSFRDATERTQAAKELEETNDQLRLLSRRRIQEQEEERRRLSRELHDQIGQSLTAAKLNVEALRATTNPALVGRVDETIAILDQLLGQVRQISLDLRPPMLDDLGLVPALRSLIDEQGRRASVAVRFSAEHIPEKLDPEIQITCFRIAQEAITNAVRHANATQLDIALRIARGKKLRLLARDNGIGFDAEATRAQAVDLGLIGIRERAALVGGRAKIISSPRKGTTIDVALPLTFRPERQARHM